MCPRLLLINPPIYDFSAYDFWLKPYGLLSVAGRLRGRCALTLYDFMDRFHATLGGMATLKADAWGRGKYYAEQIARPRLLENIPRHYHRFGAPRQGFRSFLKTSERFDYALVQTGMTYWYPGIQEVIEDLRQISPKTQIILGGVYATICASHARGLGADLVIEGSQLDPLWQRLQLTPSEAELPWWDGYPTLKAGVLKLTDGCPLRCTYCAVPAIYPAFRARPLERALAEYDVLQARGVQNVAFYDDALLHQAERVILPFLEAVAARGAALNLHTPNAIHARLVTPPVAQRMIAAGFKIIFLGFESSNAEWQRTTGAKVYAEELIEAVENLRAAGATHRNLKAYLLLGHPRTDLQKVEDSVRLAHQLGLAVMLSEFSPLPGTPDGEACRRWIDLDEPLLHNKTAFPILSLGAAEVNRLKNLVRELNQALEASTCGNGE